MLAFIQAKATELGAQKCSHCGQLDVGFGMAGSDGNGGLCTNCQETVPRYSALKTMQFSLEVFRELVANYNDVLGNTTDGRVFAGNMVQSLSNFLEPIQSNGKLPDDSDMMRLQAAMKTMKVVIGSEEKLGGALGFEFGKYSLLLGKKSYETTVATLAVCALAFLYIVNYPTKAVTIPPKPATPKPASPEKKGFFSRWFS